MVQTGLLGDADAADIGVPALSLGELHGAAAARLLGKLGATVRLQHKVAAIEAKGPNEFAVQIGRTAEGEDMLCRRRRGARGAARGGRAADPAPARCPPRPWTAGPGSAPRRS